MDHVLIRITRHLHSIHRRDRPTLAIVQHTTHGKDTFHGTQLKAQTPVRGWWMETDPHCQLPSSSRIIQKLRPGWHAQRRSSRGQALDRADLQSKYLVSSFWVCTMVHFRLNLLPLTSVLRDLTRGTGSSHSPPKKRVSVCPNTYNATLQHASGLTSTSVMMVPCDQATPTRLYQKRSLPDTRAPDMDGFYH